METIETLSPPKVLTLPINTSVISTCPTFAFLWQMSSHFQRPNLKIASNSLKQTASQLDLEPLEDYKAYLYLYIKKWGLLGDFPLTECKKSKITLLSVQHHVATAFLTVLFVVLIP